jgi:hypothetical protein
MCGCRITIPGIRQHVWFQQALQPPYSQALTDLLAEQKKIEDQVGGWVGGWVEEDGEECGRGLDRDRKGRREAG